MCNHRVCAKLKKSGACGSLSVVLAAPGPNPMVLLVKQNSGQYEGKYTVCSGKRDTADNECWIATAVRELREEMKLAMTETQFLQMCSNGGETRVIRKGPTPIFVCILPELQTPKCRLDPLVIFRDSLNRAIETDRNDDELPAEYKEVIRVDWFDLNMKIYVPGGESFSDADIVFSQYATIIFPHLERQYKKLLRRTTLVSP